LWIETAIMNQQFETADWGLATGFSWDKDDACYRYAYNGHLPMLKFAYAHGSKWHDGICCLVSTKGHVEILKWAHELNLINGFHDIAKTAVLYEQLEVLKWIIETGYDFDEEIYKTMICHSRIALWIKHNYPNLLEKIYHVMVKYMNLYDILVTRNMVEK
jgi:hypothetical protein